MKTISPGLITHLAGEVSTLATCWRVTRTDGQIFRFTDHSEDLPVGSEIFDAQTGYGPSAIETVDSMAVQNMEVTSVFDATGIIEADMLAGLWDNATVEWFVVNYKATADGPLKIIKGRLGEVRSQGFRFSAELRGLTQHLSQAVGELYTPTCRADLFDARCGLNSATFLVTGTVTEVASRANFRDTSRTEADDWFSGGKITWTSGLNDGYSMEIKYHGGSPGEFILFMPMFRNIQVGDTYEMLPGCRKRHIEDCKTKYNNIVNFRGEPFVAGIDAMTRGI